MRFKDEGELPFERGILIILFGVLLPVITILVELTQHLCARELFDPFPTVGHIFVIAAVPVANGFALWALWERSGSRLDAVIFGQAVAVAVAGVYTLIFLPLTPLGVMAIPMAGIGFLPLTPILALFASVRALRRLRRLRDALGLPPRRRVRAGLLAGIGVLVALQIPTAATRVLVALAASDNPSVSHTGLHWLRHFGDRDLLLRACYQRPTAATDLLSALVNAAAPVPPDRMREIYYRVTGRPFETEPRPRLGRSRGLEENEWDVSQGGTEVGVLPLRGLALASSRLDGSIDGRAALAYLEWTFELRNEAPLQREARAEVALPPGAVVSRVTLWIDGEEKEAAYAGRDVTRRAYQRVVQARRDPILVTTTAPDRVLVQCFPVPPGGGVMKARLGITAPLRLDGPAAGTLGLPYFVQRNFEVPAAVGHAVWIASKDRFAAPAAPLLLERVAEGEEVRGRLAEPVKPGPLATVTVQRPDVAVAWTSDGGGIVRQTLRRQSSPAPRILFVVIDGSAAMAGSAPAMEATLRALPRGTQLAVLVSGDRTLDLLGGIRRFDAQERAAFSLRRVDFEGGVDSLPALLAAWAGAAPLGGAVLWIHGPQPVLLGPAEELRQRLERRAGGPLLYTYAAAAGENRLLASLADAPGVQAVPRLHPGHEDLARFIGELDGTHQRLVPVRERLEQSTSDGVKTSDHLARLWARDRIEALVRGGPGSAADRQQALALASRYHLVTLVSGAVVLETQQQYQGAGLDPTQASQVPTVPEPGTWALLALVAAVLIGAVIARRRSPAFPHAA